MSGHKYIEEYLKKTCEQIRYKSVHKSVSDELKDHIEEQKMTYIKSGYSEEEAVLKALDQMGDPVLVGNQLNRAHQPQTEWSILLLTITLIIVGGAIQLFLSTVNSDTSGLFSKFLMYAPIGIAVFLIVYFFDYRLISKFSKTFYFILLGGTIAGFYYINMRNGAYYHVFYTTLLFIPLFAGIVYGFRNKGYLGIIACGLFYIVAAITCLIAPVFSSFLLLSISSLIILTVAIKKGFFGVSKIGGLVLLYIPVILSSIIFTIFVFLQSPYRIRRVISIFDPEKDPMGAGYNAIWIRKIFKASRPFGEAIIEGGTSKIHIHDILPCWDRDFLFAYIIGSLGYIAGFLLVAIITAFLIRVFKSVVKQKNSFGFLFSLGAFMSICGQIILFLVGNTGFCIFSPGTLPFISYGGSGFLVNMILIGVILGVYRRSNIVADKIEYNTMRSFIRFEGGKLIIDFNLMLPKKKFKLKE